MNIHLFNQTGIVLSIEIALLAIITVAATIVVMTAAMDLLPVLHEYLHSWVTDAKQSLEDALRRFCNFESMENHNVLPNNPVTGSFATSMYNGDYVLQYGSRGCAFHTIDDDGAKFVITGTPAP